MNTPTPRTDEAWAAWPYAGSGMSVHVGRELERELTAVTEQRDRLAEALKYQKELNEWIENADPEDPFFDEGLRLGLNHASDLATEALAAVKGGNHEA